MAIKLKLYKNKKAIKNIETFYEVISKGKNDSGLEFNVGDKFRVLESDNEAVLIEKLGDTNSPYYVSSDFLHAISNFAN